MKTLNPEIFKNPDLLLFESKGSSGIKELLITIVLVIAGIAAVYFGITPTRRSYRYGVYIVLPDPNWFLFGLGIVVLLIALFFFVHFINVKFCSMKITPEQIRGYGVSQTLVHLVLPVTVEIPEIREIEEKGGYLQICTEKRKIRFYMPKEKQQEAKEILEALKEHYQAAK